MLALNNGLRSFLSGEYPRLARATLGFGKVKLYEHLLGGILDLDLERCRRVHFARTTEPVSRPQSDGRLRTVRPTTRELVDGIANALERQVSPVVQDKWAASVLRSAVQLLRHVAVRVEDEARLLVEDNADAHVRSRTQGGSCSVVLTSTRCAP